MNRSRLLQWIMLLIVLLIVVSLVPALSLSPARAQSPKPQGMAGQSFVNGGYLRVTTNTVNEKQPAVAYNSADKEFAVVWSQALSGSADPLRGIWARRLSTVSATALDVAKAILSDADMALVLTEPRIAYNSLNNEYLIVWTHRYSLTDYDIEGMVVDENLNPLTGNVLYIDTAAGIQSAPAVAWDVVHSQYAVVYQSGTNIVGRLIVPGGGTISARQTLVGGRAPDLAYSKERDQFMLFYLTGSLVRQRVLSWDLSSSFGDVLVSATGPREPAVAAGGSVFLGLWPEWDVSSATAIRGRRSPANSAASYFYASGSPDMIQREHPRLDYLPLAGHYLAAWEERSAASGWEADIWGSFIPAVSGAQPTTRFLIDIEDADGDQLGPAVACSHDSAVCIVAEEDGYWTGVVGASEIGVWYLKLRRTFLPITTKNQP